MEYDEFLNRPDFAKLSCNRILYHVRRQVYKFGGLLNEKFVADIQTKMLTHWSKANLNERIFLVKSLNLETKKPEVENWKKLETPVRGFYGRQELNVPF